MSTKKKPVAINDDALFNSLKSVDTPVKTQKVIEASANKRDGEESYTLWIDKSLKKDLKKIAIEEDTNVKELIIEAVITLVKQWKLSNKKD